MNLKYLGDALDHWKGSIFGSLETTGLLQNFAVDPMITDSKPWSPGDFLIYARLLRLRDNQVLRHARSLQDRKGYFTELTHVGDLFLDPDTGISTGPRNEQYVMPHELGQQLDRNSTRLAIVYQHIRAQKCAARIDRIIAVLSSHIGQVSWCSYESPTVALLFLSRDDARVKPLASHFEAILGRHAGTRIRGIHFDELSARKSIETKRFSAGGASPS